MLRDARSACVARVMFSTRRLYSALVAPDAEMAITDMLRRA